MAKYGKTCQNIEIYGFPYFAKHKLSIDVQLAMFHGQIPTELLVVFINDLRVKTKHPRSGAISFRTRWKQHSTPKCGYRLPIIMIDELEQASLIIDQIGFLLILPSGNLTYFWKITIFHGNTHYFHGHFQ